MPTPKFSKVFRLAATYLSPLGHVFPGPDEFTHTCPAISRAYADLSGEYFDSNCPIRRYYPLADVPYVSAFANIPDDQTQGARFLWLCLLAEIAESEGN